jgi:hypothetical protein
MRLKYATLALALAGLVGADLRKGSQPPLGIAVGRPRVPLYPDACRLSVKRRRRERRSHHGTRHGAKTAMDSTCAV